MPERAPQIDPTLCKQILRRLGLSSAPSAGLEGLCTVYRAWCSEVPFENTRKMAALRRSTGAPLPGGDARDFFESWLESGTGGTCWPTSNALYGLLVSLGFEARRSAGCMRDLGIVNHGTVVVTVRGRAWLADSSLLSNVPLPLDGSVFIHDDPIFRAEVERDGSTYVVWSHTPPNSQALPCRLSMDVVSHTFYLARYEESRQRSAFNQRLYARRNRSNEMVILFGNTRYAKTAEGVESRVLSPKELCAALETDIGLSAAVIDEWKSAGCLEDSFALPPGPKPPPVIRVPPSLRPDPISVS